MAEGTAQRSLEEALAEVSRRQGEAETRHKAELTEVDSEVESLRAAMTKLQYELDALHKFRDELAAKLDAVGGGLHQATYDAIFEVLGHQARALSGRAADVASVVREQRAAAAAALAEGDLKGLYAEYQAFKEEMEPNLDSIPASYREVLLAKHRENEARIAEAVAASEPGVAQVDADDIAFDVVIGVDGEGVADVVMMILPVVEQVQTAWSEREEDLQTWIAARAMQGTYRACRALGLKGAQALYGGLQGLLGVEIELGAGDPQVVAETLAKHIGEALASAELAGAKAVGSVRVVDVDFLFPPDDEGDAPEDAADAAEESDNG